MQPSADGASVSRSAPSVRVNLAFIFFLFFNKLVQHPSSLFSSNSLKNILSLIFTLFKMVDSKVPEPKVSDPPSYSDATATTSATAYGDGNVFTDLPRPTMAYSTARREAYQPRRKGWSTGFFDCFRDPGASTFISPNIRLRNHMNIC